MAKDWNELPNKCDPVANPAPRIRKFDVAAGPLCLQLGSLDIAGDGSDYDNYDWRAQLAKNFGEKWFAG